MSVVLVDNWNLSDACLVKVHDKYIPNESYSNLLSAFVLWDEVHYLDDGTSKFEQLNILEGTNIKTLLKPIFLDKKIKKKFEKSSKIIYKEKYRNEHQKVIAQRAIFYHEISKAFGVDYYPIKMRADFLADVLDKWELWSRNEILKSEEKEILNRIQEFNTGDESNIKFPILFNLIMKNSNGDYIGTALNIKNSKEVQNFRKYMDKIDQEINVGNFDEAKYILSLIPFIIDDIEKMDKKINLTAFMKIKLEPMVLSMITGNLLSATHAGSDLLNWGLFCYTLQELFKESYVEVTKEWTNKKYLKKIQLNFLKTLAKEYFKR